MWDSHCNLMFIFCYISELLQTSETPSDVKGAEKERPCYSGLSDADESEMSMSADKASSDTNRVDKENCTSVLTASTENMTNHKGKSDSKATQMDSEDKENIKEDVNASPGETTTKVLSKALKTLVSEDIDTVTPPRKAKSKTPVKKRLNLFRPYDLDDRKKTSLPSQSPMLLRANYDSKGHTNFWHIERRNKSEAILPRFCGTESARNQNKSKTANDNQPETDSTNVCANKINAVKVNEKDTNKSRFTACTSDHSPFQAPAPKHLSCAASTHAPVRRETCSVTNTQPGVILSTVPKNSITEKPVHPVDRASQLESEKGGSVKVFQVPPNYISKGCQEISSTRPLVRMLQNVPNAMENLSNRIPKQKVLERHIRPSITGPSTSVSFELTPSLRRPDSCPPRMVSPNSSAGIIHSLGKKGIYTNESGDLTDSVKETWAIHHSTAADLPHNKKVKTILPSIATFSNKVLQPKQILQPEGVQKGPHSQAERLSLFQRFPILLSDVDTGPREEQYDKCYTHSRNKTAPHVTTLDYQGPSVNLKRPRPRSSSEPNTKACKLSNELADRINANVQQFGETDSAAMRIPLQPPIPSPKTNCLKDFRNSSQNICCVGNGKLPFGLFSSHSSEAGAMTSSRHCESSQRQFNKPYSERQVDKETDSTVEKVKKKLDMSSVTNIAETQQKVFCLNGKPDSLTEQPRQTFKARHSEEGSAEINAGPKVPMATYSQKTSTTEIPKLTLCKSQDTLDGQSNPRYDIENLRNSTEDVKVKFEKPYYILPHPANISRRPLGLSVLQNQISSPDQRIPSRVATTDPKPFSVLRTPETTFDDRSKQHPLVNEAFLPTVTPSYRQQPFTGPVPPVRPSSSGLPPLSQILPQPSPVFGPSVVSSRPPLSPLPVGAPVAEKLPVAALLMMMKVSAGLYFYHRENMPI